MLIRMQLLIMLEKLLSTVSQIIELEIIGREILEIGEFKRSTAGVK